MCCNGQCSEVHWQQSKEIRHCLQQQERLKLWFKNCSRLNLAKELLQTHFYPFVFWICLDDMLFAAHWPVIKLYHKWFITKNIRSTLVYEKWLYFSLIYKRTKGDLGDHSSYAINAFFSGIQTGRFTVCPGGIRLITLFLAYIIRNRWTILFNYHIA